MTESRKSGDNLFNHLHEVLKILLEWGVETVAVCSDAGPDASKARRLLIRVRRDIVSLDCYSHQVSTCFVNCAEL